MAETQRGKKFIEIQAYSYKRGGVRVQVPRHDRSTPRTAHGRGR